MMTSLDAKELLRPIDDASWGLLGNALRDAVESRSFFAYRLVLDERQERVPTGHGTQAELRALEAEATVEALIAQAAGVLSTIEFSHPKGDPPQPDPIPERDTRVRIEAGIFGGRAWVPIAEIPYGEDRTWRVIRYVWPEVVRPTPWTRLVRLWRRFLGNGKAR